MSFSIVKVKPVLHKITVIKLVVYEALRQDRCNGCTNLQLENSFKNFILFKHMPFTDDPPHAFHSFFFFDFINKIEIFHSVHIKGR